MYETSKIVFFPGDPEDDGPQPKQQKKWSWWTLVVSDNDRNQRTGGGRGQIARHSTRRVQADADSARLSSHGRLSLRREHVQRPYLLFSPFQGAGQDSALLIGK